MTFKFQTFLFLLLLMNSSAHCAAAEDEGQKRYCTSFMEGRFNIYTASSEEAIISSEELDQILRVSPGASEPLTALDLHGIQLKTKEMGILREFVGKSPSLLELSISGTSIEGESARTLLRTIMENTSLKKVAVANRTYGDSFLSYLDILEGRQVPLLLVLKDTSFLSPKNTRNLSRLLFNSGINELWLIRVMLDYSTFTDLLGSKKGPLTSLCICQDDNTLPPNFHEAVKSYGIQHVLPSGKPYQKRFLRRGGSTVLSVLPQAALPPSQSAVVSLNPPSDGEGSSRFRRRPSRGNILTLRTSKLPSQTK